MRSMDSKAVVKREYGRPDIDEILRTMSNGGEQGRTCCALGCGPPAMVKDVMSKSRKVGVHTHFETFLF